MADVLEALAGALNTPPPNVEGADRPESAHRKDAIQLASNDTNLNVSDRVRLLVLFRKDITFADTYLDTTDVELRTAWVRSELEMAANP